AAGTGTRSVRVITGGRVPPSGGGDGRVGGPAAGVTLGAVGRPRGPSAGGPDPPYLAGIEGAGEVTAVGEGVIDLAAGAHVIGVGIGGGAFAEYVVLPAAAAVRLPAGLGGAAGVGRGAGSPPALAPPPRPSRATAL